MNRTLIVLALVLGACSPSRAQTSYPAMTATNYIPQNPSSVETPTTGPETFPQAADPFAKLGEPLCTGLTPENAEGPYYKAGSPERNSLLGEGLVGDRMILIGYVLDSDCTPIPKAWLDFWQADSNGNYDNSGFILRGHQYTDEQGRYLLETVLPGLYASRPIQHIHVKVQAPGGGILTTQLYFPDQAVQGLTVQVESMEKYQLVIFNFVLDQ